MDNIVTVEDVERFLESHDDDVIRIDNKYKTITDAKLFAIIAKYPDNPELHRELLEYDDSQEERRSKTMVDGTVLCINGIIRNQQETL